jgi:hypothetical protein
VFGEALESIREHGQRRKAKSKEFVMGGWLKSAALLSIFLGVVAVAVLIFVSIDDSMPEPAQFSMVLAGARFAIPAMAAVVGLIVALALLSWALRLLIRPVVWVGRRVSLATGFGVTQFAFAFLVAAALEPKPFLWVLIVFVSLVTFLAYSVPLGLVSLAGVLPNACAGGSAQECANPILAVTLGLWTGERPLLSPAATAASPSPVPLTYPSASSVAYPSAGSVAYSVNESARSVRDILHFISNILTFEAFQLLISVLMIAGIVLFLLWVGSGKSTYLRGVDWRSQYLIKLYKFAAMTAFLLFALYLSVAAIIAIPVFNDRTDKVQEGEEYIKREIPKLRVAYLNGLQDYKLDLNDLPIIDQIREQVTMLITARTPEDLKTNRGFVPSNDDLQYWLETRLGPLQNQVGELRAAASKLNAESAIVQEEGDALASDYRASSCSRTQAISAAI